MYISHDPPEHESAAAPAELIQQVRRRLRDRRSGLRVEQAYVYWIRAFLRQGGLRHPKRCTRADVQAFVARLRSLNVSRAGQRQALAALRLLYEDVLRCPPPWIVDTADRPAAPAAETPALGHAAIAD